MSRTKKILQICLAVAVIALLVQVVVSLIGHEPLNIPIFVSTGIVPVVLLVSIISTITLNKKDDSDKK